MPGIGDQLLDLLLGNLFRLVDHHGHFGELIPLGHTHAGHIKSINDPVLAHGTAAFRFEFNPHGTLGHGPRSHENQEGHHQQSHESKISDTLQEPVNE